MVFNHDDGFAQRFIDEDFTGTVDVTVLVQQRVTGLIEKQLNADIELLDSFHAHGGGGHFFRIEDRIGPQIAGDRCFNRVGAGRQQRHAVWGAIRPVAVIGARQSKMAGDCG